MLKMGFIGNGKSTNRYHLPFILERENIQVKTIYNRNPKTATWDKIEGVHYTTNLEELLTDPEIQLITISTTQSSHFEYAKKVLENGKNVLVEKPFMMTYAEAKEIFELAKERGLIVQCYQNRRFDSDFLTAQKVIESGKLGELLEVEMHYDYFRPEIPESVHEFKFYNSYLYGHGCHTIDQVLSYFGKPDDIHYDVRQLLGEGRMNDYFDLDFYYGITKVSVKSSYFRIKARPSFVLYGKKGMFTKETKDRQEEHLKLFYMPSHKDFGIDLPEHYGTLTYVDDAGVWHEEKVISEVGDYGRVYDDLYEAIINGKPKQVTDEETLLQMEILEKGVEACK
ncbi:oxidoreductase [Listeria immobilis]|uniref:Oxidoreductase n=1 Tax=Listeria immobilis TaxID=2713502 RepID=A0ABR6SSK8_9LIST|nr:oxidoreductase [Listeria immobilis]MBC1482762.1 oxidoreductase [Listeria immobilis]MBC1506024.1 oxidoreductase [Listeria immobilis]MBC1508668.1 oxidoreductase [Listeria immobilis]MBC1515955.1 oxidoreductase [Listeria immobilis]MBC6303031.1 oxidoreductase [Listeria immobilis]